ncbi:MAG: DUF4350 domain-containing protein [Pseudomonadota bacterium]
MNLAGRFDNLVYHALLVACLCAATLLGSHYAVTRDMTHDGRNSLGPQSAAVVARIDQPVTIEVYAGRGNLLVQAAEDLVARYARANPLVQFRHIDIDRDPNIARELEISGHGDIVVKMGERRRRTQALTESAVTGALESLLLGEHRRAVFVTGHGERRADGIANHDYGEFSKRLQERGYEISAHNLQLGELAVEPGDVLVVASAQTAWQSVETDRIAAYLAEGGDVLWLLDEHGPASEALARITGLTPLPGVIVDAASEALSLPQPDFAVVSEYGAHPHVTGMDGISLFPRAIAFSDASLQPAWQARALLQSTARSWNETGEIAGRIAPTDPGEETGPLTFGWQLTHTAGRGSLNVIGDGDFLANSWLGNGVNLALGERLFDALATETPLTVPPPPARDRQVNVTRAQGLWLGGVLFGALPLLLSTVAFVVWRRQVA